MEKEMCTSNSIAVTVIVVIATYYLYIYLYFILPVDRVKYLEISIRLMDTFETGSKLNFRLYISYILKNKTYGNSEQIQPSSIEDYEWKMKKTKKSDHLDDMN